MMRDYKLTLGNSGKHPNVDDMENIRVNHNRIEEQEVGDKSSKVEKIPVIPTRSRYSELLKTPDERGVTTGNRFGWAQKNEPSSAVSEIGVDLNQYRNTPRSTRDASRGGQRRPAANGGARMANFAALSRGLPSYGSSTTYVNTVEVPHFEMKEDPSFWMDHNVQVLIRVRPLNNMEKSTQCYNRCLKQESSQCITWIGHPETRFTFDHVACESVEQETLFRVVGLPMVENCLSGYNSCMFAYGQTGSGKTYTMLGDIDELGVKPSPNHGMTPHMFEFLFARIRAEEESRRDERLAYNCKCSFLEIYNEQITDLLDPSSTNLLLREDTKTGVYVENLSKFEVETVADILKLLSQGSANRKVAATYMNRESSRSHSVFTCVIESRWEKDSTSNLKFARLNLVDLAGSERQKSSGAEGERLKEAANINKSLSTLGHVIMVLVDVAHAKKRHVPYRDSRLTFLLQDSLGGNSKTMIIANVSPSVCSAAETLNTLKFAQRAKLIQNNAVVNEDSSGDVTALQNQIRILKEELLALKRQNVSRSLSFGSTIVGDARQKNGSADGMHSTDDMLGSESKSSLSISSKQEAKRDLEIQVTEVDDLKEEIISLNNERISHKEINCEALRKLSSRFEKFVDSIDSVHMKYNRIFEVLNEQSSLLENKFVEIQKYAEGASEFLEDIDSVEILSQEVISKNCYLQAELKRKDSVLEGLLFDLKMLQEYASSKKDQKDEFENLLASYEDLENGHDEAVEKVQFLDAQLREKIEFISTLELDVSRAHENVDSLSSINVTLTRSIAIALQEKEFIEKELIQKCKDNQYLESELLEMRAAVEQMNEFAESLKMNLQSVICERDAMHAELLNLKQEFQMAQNLADENGAIAIEAQQVAETRKLCLDEKEEEVRLLERSVEELERSVNVLESKKKVLELEVMKLSGQQNIQESIHHHAKIKEIEEERLQLAQKLLGLCTSILKAAGITRPASDISLPAAEAALEQLKDRSNILTKELQELKLKSKITNERNRLSELMPQLLRSPFSRSKGSRQSTPKRSSQSPFLSSLDR